MNGVSRLYVGKLEYGDVPVGEDTDVGGDLHGALDDLPGALPGDRQQRPSGGQGEVPAGADRSDTIVRLDQLARSAYQEAVLQVGDHEEGLEAAEDPVAPPVLGQLDGRPREVAGVAVQLLLEFLVEGERVG